MLMRSYNIPSSIAAHRYIPMKNIMQVLIILTFFGNLLWKQCACEDHIEKVFIINSCPTERNVVLFFTYIVFVIVIKCLEYGYKKSHEYFLPGHTYLLEDCVKRVYIPFMKMIKKQYNPPVRFCRVHCIRIRV